MNPRFSLSLSLAEQTLAENSAAAAPLDGPTHNCVSVVLANLRNAFQGSGVTFRETPFDFLNSVIRDSCVTWRGVGLRHVAPVSFQTGVYTCTLNYPETRFQVVTCRRRAGNRCIAARAKPTRD